MFSLSSILLFTGKRIGDGLPPLMHILSKSQGSIPEEDEHANCERLVQSDFFLYEVPETVTKHSSRIWGEGEIIKYGTEADIVGFVKMFLTDIISAMKLHFALITDLGIMHIAPDICVVTDGNRLVGVVEVKKCNRDILCQPTVLGELFDQMLLVEGFYCSGPVIGILTSFEEWVFAWFVADDKHFIGETSAIAAVKGEGNIFLTPTKPRCVGEKPARSWV